MNSIKLYKKILTAAVTVVMIASLAVSPASLARGFGYGGHHGGGGHGHHGGGGHGHHGGGGHGHHGGGGHGHHGHHGYPGHWHGRWRPGFWGPGYWGPGNGAGVAAGLVTVGAVGLLAGAAVARSNTKTPTQTTYVTTACQDSTTTSKQYFTKDGQQYVRIKKVTHHCGG